MQDRSFKRSNDINRLNTDFGNRENGFRRKNNRNNGNVEKLISKYNELAREALSNGDKILSENYYQYADHFLLFQIVFYFYLLKIYQEVVLKVAN